MSKIEEILSMKEFVTLPAIATKVLQMLENDDIEINKLANLIESDPSLSLKLLKMANSPLYGLQNRINSAKHAILLIGLNKLTNMVLGVSIFSKFFLTAKRGAGDLINKFLIHSASTAAVAKTFTRNLNVDFKDNEFLSGLLYQIGKLALIQYNVNDYLRVTKLVEEAAISDIQAEKEIFTIDHIEIGREISKMWKLPDEIQTVISNYNYHENASDLSIVIDYSGTYCELMGQSFWKGKSRNDLDANWIELVGSFAKLKELQREDFENNLSNAFSTSDEFVKML